jgi:hypothetical protein
LNIVTPALELASAPLDLGGGFPEVSALGAQRRRSGAATIALSIGSERTSLTLLRILADGSLRDAAPGVVVASLWNVRPQSPPLAFSDASDGLIWWAETGDTHAQVIDADGIPRFMPPLRVDLPGYAVAHAWAFDGSDRAYLVGASGDGTQSVRQIDSAFEPLWATPLGSCGAEPHRIAATGAYEGGAWVVWNEQLVDSDGVAYVVTKVTRIRADGSFAWTG